RERRPAQIDRQRHAALAIDHHAATVDHRADAQLGRLLVLALPGHAYLPRQEVVPSRGALIELAVAARAIVADGEAADEHLRAIVGLGDREHQGARADHSAVDDRAFVRLRPALAKQRRAGEINHRVRPIDRAGPRADVCRLPGDILSRPRRRPARLLRIAREDHYLIAFCDQLLAKLPADHSGRPGDDHALIVCHVTSLSSAYISGLIYSEDVHQWNDASHIAYVLLCNRPGQIEQQNSPAQKPAKAPFSSIQYDAAGHQRISAIHSRNGSAPTSSRSGHTSSR